jgi:hypothetical protein
MKIIYYIYYSEHQLTLNNWFCKTTSLKLAIRLIRNDTNKVMIAKHEVN